MDKTASYLLIISAGLLMFYFALIIYVWFFRYFSDLTTKKAKQDLEDMFSTLLSVINNKTNNFQGIKEVQEITSFVKNSGSRKESLINIIISYGDDFTKTNHQLLMKLCEVTEIKSYLIERLTSKSSFKKSLACRQLGELKLENTEKYILKLSSCKNNDVRYNVLLSLAKLGDLKRLVYILTKNHESVHLSHRAVIEIISAFNGSKENLFHQTLPLSDDYIKGVLIKAAADYKIEGLRDYYIKYLKNDDKNLRIACIRALCDLENSNNEGYIINMLDDKEWEVRAASAKSLEEIGTCKSFTALAKTAGDTEWWVRHNAACTLILLYGGKEYASKIISGNDKYAKEAIVSAIEMVS